MQRIKDIAFGLMIGIILTILLPDAEKERFRKERSEFFTTCINQKDKMQILMDTIQHSEEQHYVYEKAPKEIEVKKFIGVLFWTDNARSGEETSFVEGSEIQIIEHGAPQKFLVPKGATGYLLKGRFFEN